MVQGECRIPDMKDVETRCLSREAVMNESCRQYENRRQEQTSY